MKNIDVVIFRKSLDTMFCTKRDFGHYVCAKRDEVLFNLIWIYFTFQVRLTIYLVMLFLIKREAPLFLLGSSRPYWAVRRRRTATSLRKKALGM